MTQNASPAAFANRRQILTLLASAPLLALPACSSMGGWSLTDAVRELLSLSSQRAIASLVQPGGFYDSQVARIDLPNQLGNSGNILSRLLTSSLMKDRLTREVNSAAERGAERAAPILADAIRNISITDAVAILRGGPTAATGFLQNAMGRSLVTTMFPSISGALDIASNPVVNEVLRSASGVNVAALADDVAIKANDAIFRAIGREETAIRANPRSTGNPVLIGALALGV
jgi:hypothetical protein